jgi:hypothetical protein
MFKQITLIKDLKKGFNITSILELEVLVAVLLAVLVAVAVVLAVLVAVVAVSAVIVETFNNFSRS